MVTKTMIAQRDANFIDAAYLPSRITDGMGFSSVTLPRDFPLPPTYWESYMAATLLTRGKLKAFSHELGFGNNGAALRPLLDNRLLAEAILERVPSVRVPVYEWVLPPLSRQVASEDDDQEGDSMMALIGPEINPMPQHVRHLPARVTAFSSHPWGQVGVYLVLFDEPEQLPRWGMWYLREPSAKTGTRFPFFRLQDFNDAELLVWLVLKPFLEAEDMVLENINPPEEGAYQGPWHKVRDRLRFNEVSGWFAKVLNPPEEV